MNQAKLQLSAEEMRMAANKEFILTKQEVIKKVCELMGALSVNMQKHITEKGGYFPPEIINSSPKISKGEQYRQMPYVVLDYPRFFSKEDVFAVRMFFWWGHYFSSTLHLKGKYLSKYSAAIIQAIGEGLLDEYDMESNGDEFNFDLNSGNYQKIKNAMSHTAIDAYQFSFLKLSRSYSINDSNEIPDLLFEDFKKYLSFCTVV
jgi:hypothetical protein